MGVFTGFDSAWGRRNRGALCHLVLREDGALEFVAPPSLCGWREAVAWAKATPWDDHFVAIDQGLVVPNATGMRPVERKLASAMMRGFGCGCHASNTRNPCYGPDAGIWDFLEALDARGYVQDPMAIPGQATGRYYFECFPHPALLGLFDLDGVLKYKVRHGDIASWRRLLALLRSLETADPPLRGVAAYAHTRLPQNTENENKLDSLIAAYVGAFWWRHGTARSMSVGRLSTGYIVTPVCTRTQASFARVFTPAEINECGRAISARPVRKVARGRSPAPCLQPRSPNASPRA